MEYFENEIDGPDWQKLWKLKKELLQNLLEKCGIPQNEIATIPKKQDPTANYYCPFCMTEYSIKRQNCIDCDIALKKFPNGG